MKRLGSLAWLGALGTLCGCGSGDVPPGNQPPTVSWLSRPAPGSTVSTSATFEWTGSDPDGSIGRFEWSLDSETRFDSTTETRMELMFDASAGTVSNPGSHVFRLRAVDDRGLVGETLASAFLVAVPEDSTGAPAGR